MNKADYLERLRQRYPGEPDTVLELEWHLHDMEKTKRYIQLLETCNTNADIARKAVREMYVAGDIDEIKAKSRNFISALLPFPCLAKEGKTHSIAYHIKAMLDDPEVRAERRALQERRKAQRVAFGQEPEKAVQVRLPELNSGILIHVLPDKRIDKFLKAILELAELGVVQILQVQGQGEGSATQGQDGESTPEGGETPSPSSTPSTFYVNNRRKLQALSMVSAYIQDRKRRQTRNMLTSCINRQGIMLRENKIKAGDAVRLLTKSVWAKPRDMRSAAGFTQDLGVKCRVLSDRETMENIGLHKGITIMKMK